MLRGFLLLRARQDRDMFVVRVSGRSMEPMIHDGDLCLMRRNPQGGDIEIQDGDKVIAAFVKVIS